MSFSINMGSKKITLEMEEGKGGEEENKKMTMEGEVEKLEEEKMNRNS